MTVDPRALPQYRGSDRLLGAARAPVGGPRYLSGMPILAAYDHWWLASPRFRHFRAPPSPAGSALIGSPIMMRLGLRFAGTLMHRSLAVAAISDGYIVPDDPNRALVTWKSPVRRKQHEAHLVEAAQHFRSSTGREGPVDTDLLIANFLFMLMQRAGELAYHADFAMGARRAESSIVEDDLEGGATWIFGGGPADSLETVSTEADSSVHAAGRIVGWPDGTVYVVDPDGEAFEISSDPELVEILLNKVRRKRERAERSQ